MSNNFADWLRGLVGRRGPSGPVPTKDRPEFSCWNCRVVLPKAGVTCPNCGEPPAKL